MDQGEGPGRGGDGVIDFGRYTTAQLSELLALIDPASRPLDHAHLLAEIARREGPDHLWTGRFTPGGGIPGWITALRDRQPLYGDGTVELSADGVILHGWRRTWLGVAAPVSLPIPFNRIRNVVAEGGMVRFDCGLLAQVRFQAATPAAAAALAAALPDTRSTGFERKWGAARQFNLKLMAAGRYAWVTWALVLLNAGIFAALAWHSQRLAAFSGNDIMIWGGNYGPLTASGEWWRLLASAFLHLDWMHVTVNMWALAGVGRLTERLYGHWRYAGLYLALALVAGMASIIWQPSGAGAGASGAIFGVFGLFLAYLARHHGRIPVSVIWAHWPSSLVFVLFSLFSGMHQSGVDNAAHVGGLVAGLLLGLLAAPRLDDRGPESWSLPQAGLVTGLVLAMLGGGYAHVRGSDLTLSPWEKYGQERAWLNAGMGRNDQRWGELAAGLASGQTSGLEIAEAFEKEIIPFWREAEARLLREDAGLKGEQARFAAVTLELVKRRGDMAAAIAKFGRSGQDPKGEIAETADKLTSTLAHVQVFQLRAAGSHRPSGVANITAMEYLSRRLFGGAPDCVKPPDAFGVQVAAGDNPQDGPARWMAAACAAQRLFRDEDYAGLEALFTAAAGRLGDLPDGTSTLDALAAGLSNFTRFGQITVDDGFGRLVAWANHYPQSTAALLMQAQFLTDWGWSARGHATANAVPAQAMSLFNFRSRMADAVLGELKEQAVNHPLWYSLSLDMHVNLSKGKDGTLALFQTGTAKFPAYYRLHRQVLRALMPRWFGSHQEVRDFIEEEVARAPDARKSELYARLFWTYRNLEDDDLNLMDQARMRWGRVREGMRALIERYPDSDYWLNAAASFACHVGDDQEYARFRPLLAGRMSATAWRPGETVESCDTTFAQAKAKAQEEPAPPEPEQEE